MNKYQPTVNKVDSHFGDNVDQLVHKGKLLLKDKSQTGIPEIGDLCDHGNNGYCIIKDQKHLDFADKHYYIAKIPFIISVTEDLRVGDYAYDNHFQSIFVIENEYHLHTVNGVGYCDKVLVLSEQLSDDHLEAIAEGELKDGDEVLVKCYQDQITDEYFVHHVYPEMIDKHHITLYPVKQSLEEAIEQFFENNSPSSFDNQMRNYVYRSDQIEKAIKYGVEWAKKNM